MSKFREFTALLNVEILHGFERQYPTVQKRREFAFPTSRR
jgi:hypothetical protein